MNYFFSINSPIQLKIAEQLESLGISASEEKHQFGDENLTLEKSSCELLEHKHKLASLLKRHDMSIMPTTYYIDELNYLSVLDKLDDHNQWIIKPSLLNNGQGIHLLKDKQAVVNHFKQSHRFSGPHVLQHYIHPPHLLNGYKYTFRLLVVITNFSGSFLYPMGYYNLANTAYCSNLAKTNAHLTNEHLNPDDSVNVTQIPTSQYPSFDKIHRRLIALVEQTISAFEREACLEKRNANPAFSFFGFDFLTDADLKPWLLEINHCPCFPTIPHPLNEPLYIPFWQNVCHDFVLPIMDHQAKIKPGGFIPLITRP